MDKSAQNWEDRGAPEPPPTSQFCNGVGRQRNGELGLSFVSLLPPSPSLHTLDAFPIFLLGDLFMFLFFI